MKALKIIGIALVSILLIIVVVGYMQPSTVEMSNSKVINAPVCVVFDHVNDMKKRAVWSPWVNMDTTMQLNWSEITQGEGASYSWISEVMGNGSMTYTLVTPLEKVESELDFSGQGGGHGIFYFEEVEDGTKVTWDFKSEMGSNPFAKLMGAIMKPGLESTFKAGLESLTEAAVSDEANPCLTGDSLKHPSLSDHLEVLNSTDVDGIEVVEVQLPEWHYIGIKDSSDVNGIEPKMGQNYGTLSQFMKENDLDFVTAPVASYYTWEPPKKVVFSSMIPVSKAIEGTETIQAGTMPTTKAIRVTHAGAYEGMEATWNAAYKYMGENGLKENGVPFEEYVTDPHTTQDTALWLTHIYVPVQ